MPEIDVDTFQVIALVLLVAAVALSALALITVTRLRDELLDRNPEQPAHTAAPGSSFSDPSTYGSAETYPRTSTPLPANTEAPAWASGAGSETGTPAAGGYAESGAGYSTPASTGYEPTPSTTSYEPTPATSQEPAPASTGYEPASTGYDPAPSTEYEPTSATSQEPAPARAGYAQTEPAEAEPTTAAEPMPEEQPFEREGRWWYKRGDELLVYDEGSGQWEAAPAGPLGSSPPGSGAGDRPPSTGAAQPSAATDYASVTGGATGSPGGAVHDDPGGFWKCTSCGAINGSTAGSCRMCFAVHP